ncbi:calmodulin-binding protein 60 A-like isoform X1 [Salvia splendens]|uniref:calmodulin-binding protein 60 A-like isoform X1 n=1 Tax=Salvia splendens TaxID=180675 RepID=UPI001C258C23|nr:calmodulin-binding protein 60 A-like isoform X1 [Salvia splendens]
MERDPNGGSSEHPSCSYARLVPTLGSFSFIEDVAIYLHSQAFSEGCPVSLDRVRGIVIEGFQPAAGRLLRKGTRLEFMNEFSEERSLQLKFLDNKVADTVTGKELKGLKGECLKLALLDSNGHTVTHGPGSSAKVEILLLEDNGDSNEHNLTLEKFERSIIQTGDKKRPHFSRKSVEYILLKKGVADLNDTKLGHDSKWSRLCSCRLGARIAQNLKGITVHEAWTAPFKVKDKRGNQNEKYPCPYLTSEVWRLKEISRKGKRCERLEKNHIKTVHDFLFWYHVNPEELQNKILDVGDGSWKTIVSHAQDCKIDCEKMFCHESSSEPQRCVIYDCVGKLKGEMIESQFVGIDNMCADKKDDALKLLRSVLQRASALYDDENEFTCPIGSKERGEVSKPDAQLTPLHNSDILGDMVRLPPDQTSVQEEADADKLLASACQNWGQGKAFDYQNSLQQHLAGLSPYIGGSSSSIHLDTSCHSFDPMMSFPGDDAFFAGVDDLIRDAFGYEHGPEVLNGCNHSGLLVQQGSSMFYSMESSWGLCLRLSTMAVKLICLAVLAIWERLLE